MVTTLLVTLTIVDPQIELSLDDYIVAKIFRMGEVKLCQGTILPLYPITTVHEITHIYYLLYLLSSLP